MGWYCCGTLLPVFGVRVSVTFHLMFVHIMFSLALVAEWPPFGKELLTWLNVCSLCILTIFPVLVSRAGVWVLIASNPGHRILVIPAIFL